MEKKTLTLASLLVLTLVAGAGFVAAFGGFGQNQAMQDAVANNDYAAWKAAGDQAFTQDRFTQLRSHFEQTQAVQDALKNSDFTAWKTAMKDAANARIDAVTQDQFDTMAKAYQDGKTNGMGFGFGRGHMRGFDWNGPAPQGQAIQN